MTAKKITPTNPDTLPVNEDDKAAAVKTTARKTATASVKGRKTAGISANR